MNDPRCCIKVLLKCEFKELPKEISKFFIVIFGKTCNHLLKTGRKTLQNLPDNCLWNSVQANTVSRKISKPEKDGG